MPSPNSFRVYLRTLRRNLDLGTATEHTHRPALKALLETLDITIDAVNEPRRIECGAPDFVVTKKGPDHPTIGYIEAKDIGRDLNAIERDSDRRAPNSTDGQQLRRYRQSLSNLVLTDYVEFRRYADGELVQTARLAADTVGGLIFDPKGAQAVHELLAAFFLQVPEPVASAQELAVRMARITHMIRDVVAQGFEQGNVSQNLHGLYRELKKTLDPGLQLDAFADMFAQTLAYGLFAARVDYQGPGSFRWQDAAHHIPRTNRFIRPLFNLVTGPDLNDEPFVSFVDDLAQLLGVAEMEAVLADFGRHGVRQDPIMNFYETFLAAYDPTERERRGVYYTPEPVISYIVRSVDYLLRERFDCAEGLADYRKAQYANSHGEVKESHRVLVLDPACGTGSFLYAVIEHIREHYQISGQGGLWTGYVREHLLPRLFGFELLMAAYAMAHLKLGMQLAALDLPEASRAAWAYPFEANERLGVYLTNALEPVEASPEPLFGLGDALANEARAAAGVKHDLPIMVVLGNPPYSGHSANASRKNGKLTWIGKLIEDYKRVDGQALRERNPKWLQDDYVKFIRFGQRRIQQSGAGILAFITNHAYLNNPTFRGMRQQLMDTFSDIYLLDLHGNARLRERTPDGGADENVFDIGQGVAIALFIKTPGANERARVYHADLWGERESKYATLAASDVTTTAWEKIEPESPTYLFKPWDKDLEQEYMQWPKITDLMPVKAAGVVTARDKLTIRWSRDEALDVAQDFASLAPEDARIKYNLGRDVQDWRVGWAQEDLRASGIRPELVRPILYRPFDTRYTYYTGVSRGFICRPRKDVMQHMLDDMNIGLIATRQTSDKWGVFATKTLIGHKAYAAQDINSLFPLYVYPEGFDADPNHPIASKRQPNLDSKFTAKMERCLDLRFVGDGAGDLDLTFGPEDVFHYFYAVLHAPTYHEHYAQFLRSGFPRVPLPDGLDRFRVLAALGRDLSATHLLEGRILDGAQTRFPIPGDGVVEPGYPKYVAPGETPPGEREPVAWGRVYLSRSSPSRGGRPARQGQYFDRIEPDLWRFSFGGYRPMEKWLKDRKGRTLGFEDFTHYGRIATATRETIRLISEIDRVGLPSA